MQMIQHEGVVAQNDILLAENLSKVYPTRVALEELSFSLKAGRVMGFLGPNGAGKTTTIRILTTMLEPTSGNFFVAGISSKQPEKIRRMIGVLPENLGVPKQITGIEYLTYFGQLYGRSAAEARAIGGALLRDVGMEHRGNGLVGTYSHGMRQRLGIARALVNDPMVIFLDEPTLGLDPRGQHELILLIQRIARERNTGVVLSSHLLSEIEGICDDVVIMNSGKVVAHGAMAEVIDRFQKDTAQQKNIQLRISPSDMIRARHVLESLPEIKQVMLADKIGSMLNIELSESDDPLTTKQPQNHNKVLDAVIQADIPIQGYELSGGKLKDVFLQLTAESIG
jgi:ABC-2 type transport system ATP-binding protein